MKQEKKTGFILMCLSVMILICGCGLKKYGMENDKKREIKIGISVYDNYDTFISELMDSFDKQIKAIEARAGVTISVDVENAAGSQTKQNAQVEDFIDYGCDVICVNLVDRTDPTMIIDKAKAADIPVIFFNRELVEEDLERFSKLYYVGAVTLESGILEGQLVVESCENNFEEIDTNGDGILQYVILEGEAGHQDAIVRTEYSINTVIDAGYRVEKLEHAIANWNRAQAQTKMDSWIEQFGNEIEVVFANNDDMALGAIDAYKAANVKKEDMPLIVGIDGTKVGLEAIREGTLKGTVLNDRDGQARAMAELCYSLVTKQELPEDISLVDERYIRLQHQKVTIDNLDEIYDRLYN